MLQARVLSDLKRILVVFTHDAIYLHIPFGNIDDRRVFRLVRLGFGASRKTHRPVKPLTRPLRENKPRTYSPRSKRKSVKYKTYTHTIYIRDTHVTRLLERLARGNKHKHTHRYSLFLKINATAPFNEVACKLCIAVCFLYTLRLPIVILKPADTLKAKKLQIDI